MRHAYFLKILLLFLLVAVYPFGHVYAQYRSNKIAPLDMLVSMSEEDFYANTRLVEEVPFGDQSLSYKVRLPGDWQRTAESSLNVENGGLNNRLLGQIVEFISPPKLDVRSRFTIQALELDTLTTAENWFMNYTLANGFVMEGFEVVSDERVEAQYVRVKNGDSYVIRAVARINGPRMILAEYAVPYKYWQEERDTQVWSMITFYMTDPDDRPIEEKKRYQFLDIAEFYYPESWYLQEPEVKRADRVDIRILNNRAYLLDSVQGNDVLMDGVINIYLVSRDFGNSLSFEIERKKQQILKNGFVLGDLIERLDDVSFPLEADIGMVDVYRVKNKKRLSLDYELWMGVIRTDSHYWIFHMFSPSRQDDFPLWARNKETLKEIIPTFKILDAQARIQ